MCRHIVKIRIWRELQVRLKKIYQSGAEEPRHLLKSNFLGVLEADKAGKAPTDFVQFINLLGADIKVKGLNRIVQRVKDLQVSIRSRALLNSTNQSERALELDPGARDELNALGDLIEDLSFYREVQSAEFAAIKCLLASLPAPSRYVLKQLAFDDLQVEELDTNFGPPTFGPTKNAKGMHPDHQAQLEGWKLWKNTNKVSNISSILSAMDALRSDQEGSHQLQQAKREAKSHKAQTSGANKKKQK